MGEYDNHLSCDFHVLVATFLLSLTFILINGFRASLNVILKETKIISEINIWQILKNLDNHLKWFFTS